eukprot:tig00020952_g16491.t1
MAAVIETAERPLTTLAPSPEPGLQLNSLILSALSDLLDLAALTGDVFAYDVPWKHLTARPFASQDAIQTFKNAAFRQGYIKVAITKAFIDHETTLHALHPTGTITSSTYIHADHPGTTRTGRSERASITLALAFLDAALSRAHHLEKFLRRAFSLLNCRQFPYATATLAPWLFGFPRTINTFSGALRDLRRHFVPGQGTTAEYRQAIFASDLAPATHTLILETWLTLVLRYGISAAIQSRPLPAIFLASIPTQLGDLHRGWTRVSPRTKEWIRLLSGESPGGPSRSPRISL